MCSSNPFPAVADFLHQRADRGKAFVSRRVIALNGHDVRRGFPRNQIAFAFFQSFTSSGCASSAAESCWIGSVTTSVSLPSGLHRLRRISSQCLCRFPSRFSIPGRIYGGRQRMNKRMHIRGIHIVFFIPVAVGSTISEYRQVLDRRKSSVTTRSSLPSVPLSRHSTSSGFTALFTQIQPLNTMLSTQQIFQHVLMALTGRAKQV